MGSKFQGKQEKTRGKSRKKGTVIAGNRKREEEIWTFGRERGKRKKLDLVKLGRLGWGGGNWEVAVLAEERGKGKGEIDLVGF